jgi:fibronectin type 3 domain-containing protein
MKWNPFRFARLGNPARRRRPSAQFWLAAEELEMRLALSVALTYHVDTASDGANLNETQLTPANVAVGSFGKLYTTPVDGQVYAEPLVDTGVTIAAGPNTASTPGTTGVHDVVFVATENNSLYAIDSSVVGGAVLWQRSFTDITTPGYSGTTPGTNINNPLGTSTFITTVPAGDVNITDINPQIGITGTPVIDPTTNTLYLVVATKETIGGAAHYVQRLHAISIADGTDRVTPFLIGDTTNGNTNNTQIYVYGTGDGSVTDPYNGTGKLVDQFNALRENQRGALSLVNNEIYVEWASHGDNGPYHGWVVAWDISNLTTSGFVMKGVLNTSPNNGLSGIWEGGGRLAFEADGSAFYFETGNGSGGAPVLNSSGFPTNANYNDALVKVVADPTTSPTNQNPNGWGFRVADFFTPYNAAALDGADQDFGSGGPLLLPDSAGIPGHPHLMIAAGKQGTVYLIDRDKMGEFTVGSDDVISTLAAGIGGSLSTPAYYNGHIYWNSGYSNTARELTIASDGTMSITSVTAITNFGYLPGSAVVSANGNTGGIVWIMDTAANELHAYDANTLATELWNSGQKAGGADNLGAAVKFATPTVVNGEVFVGTSNSLVVYGLTPPANAVPNAPDLSAMPLSASSINLSWTDSTLPPNTAGSYLIEQSPDGLTSWNQVTTAPPGSTSIDIGGLSANTTYYYRIRSMNGLGDSQYSNIVNAMTTNLAAVLDFSSGFAGSTANLFYNGSAAINGSRAELTNGGLFQAGSFFSTTPVDISKFSNQFTFQLTTGTTADGFTFTIQDVGPTALGPIGGGLGYAGINNSVAIKFDLYDNSGEGVDSTGLYTDGATPTNVGSIDLTPSGVDLHSGDPMQVNMGYDGTTLTVTITDTITLKSATQTYTIDIPGTVGSSSAYVGFTAGTGGETATQDILTWTFSPNANQAPGGPLGLGAAPASATSVNLTWTNTATNQTGFHLDRATDGGFTQNFITESLPATPNSFTDTATGLAPGDTFYYRIRAFNTAGDSVNSNVASVTIPLAPAKPTNAAVTNVTTSEIDLSWTDNAGRATDSYQILRAVNHGAFSLYATLPAFNNPPPNTYTWSDTSVSPGTFYEYHIEAVNISGHNDFSGTNATTLTLAPTGLTATGGNNVVNLSWTAPTGAVSYNIYRGTAAGGEATTPLATGVTTTSYSDSTAVNGTTYFYTVTAVNGNASPLASESAASNEASAGTPPAAPATLTATPVGPNKGASSITLNWAASTGATSYNVYRSLNGNGETGAALATGITGTTYTDSTAAFGTTYFYKVTAVGSAGEGTKSTEASATPLFVAHIHFTAQVGGDTVANYRNDVGLAYGSRGSGLTFGWNRNNTANGHDRDASNSPDELHDGVAYLQAANNPNGYWGIAVPNGTYAVHLIAGDPTNINSVYGLNVGGTRSGTTISGGTLAISGTPSATTRWFAKTVTVTVTGGVLYVSNASGSRNNKINEIDVTQVLPGKKFANGFTAAKGLTLNGSAQILGSSLVLTNGNTNEAASVFGSKQVDIAKFTNTFSFQLVNPNADGFAFVIQGVGVSALGASGGGLGYAGINNSIAIKFDLANNNGEGIDSTGLFVDGANPYTPSIDLTGTGIDLHSGHVFNVAMTYDGSTLTVTITDATTKASATQSYLIDIVSTVGGSMAWVGFTGGTSSSTATQSILSWTFAPIA